MEAVFLKLVNMSLTASWLVLAVLLLRLLLKNAPKYIRVILWGFVGIRLVFPLSLESMFSMIPSSEPLPEEFLYAAEPQINTGIPVINNSINPIITQSMAPAAGASVNPTQVWSFIFSQIWILGLVLMVLYAAVSYYLVYRRVAASIHIGENLRLCDHIVSPFILGIINPQIYLPSELDPKTADLVLAHEYAHLKRKDHWWKPLGFALLCVYWFNPVMWLAYILLCRDIELACDEKVVQELGAEDKKAYSTALLRCSVNRKMIAACPLAFGEVGVKDRIKTVLNYKKPAFWVIVAAVVICVVVAVCFLTDPLPTREFPMTGHNISDMDVDTIVKRIQKAEGLGDASAYMNSNNFTLTVDSDFNWVNSQTIQYFYIKEKKVYNAQLRIFPEENQYNLTKASEWVEQKYLYHIRHYLDALKNLPQDAIRQMAPADRYLIEHVDKGRPSDYERLITYSSEGVYEIDGWFIHLRILPLHDDGEGHSGTGDEAIDLFYGQSDKSSAGYIAVDAPPTYYLTIPCEGVSQIEIAAENSSGGCVNADGTCFRKGDRVYLEQLDGIEDLRGIHIVAYDRQGVILTVISIPEAEYSQPVNTISEHGWFLGPDGADMEMNAWAAQCWDVLNQIQAMDSYHIRQEWKFEGKNVLNDSSNIDYWKSGGTMMRIGHIPDTNETIGYLLSDEQLLVSHDNSDTPNWVPEETLGLLTPKDDLNEILLPWLYQFRWNSDTTKAISRHDHSDGYTIRLKINEPVEKHHVSADSYHVDFTFDQQNRFQYATYHLESADYSRTGVFTVMETSAKEIEASIAAQLEGGNPSESRLSIGAYIPVECVYMNPLSSYYAGNISNEVLYRVTEDAFLTENQGNTTSVNVLNIEWSWKTVEEAGHDLDFYRNWLTLGFASQSRLELSAESLYQKLDENCHLILQPNGDLLLIQGQARTNQFESVWCIFRLVATTNLGEIVQPYPESVQDVWVDGRDQLAPYIYLSPISAVEYSRLNILDHMVRSAIMAQNVPADRADTAWLESHVILDEDVNCGTTESGVFLGRTTVYVLSQLCEVKEQNGQIEVISRRLIPAVLTFDETYEHSFSLREYRQARDLNTDELKNHFPASIVDSMMPVEHYQVQFDNDIHCQAVYYFDILPRASATDLLTLVAMYRQDFMFSFIGDGIYNEWYSPWIARNSQQYSNTLAEYKLEPILDYSSGKHNPPMITMRFTIGDETVELSFFEDSDVITLYQRYKLTAYRATWPWGEQPIGTIVRSWYDEAEYAAALTHTLMPVSDNGQDYGKAAAEFCDYYYATHLGVSKGSAFRYSFVKTEVMVDTEATQRARVRGEIGENDYAFWVTVYFVPENDRAHMNAMPGNTHEYIGDDPEIPADAWVFTRCGYIRHTDSVWIGEIVGTGF